MQILAAEFIGTLLLILLGNGVVANVLLGKSKGEGAGWLAICTGWGIAVAVPVYLVGWASGAHINPAVTLGMALLGKTPWERVPLYVLGQMAGAFMGAILVWAAYLPHWSQPAAANFKLMVFCTKPAIRKTWANFLTEVIATAVLLIGILGIVDGGQDVTPSLQPFLIGVLVLGIGVSLGGPTGFAINPARDLAPRIAHAILPIPEKGSSDWGYAWVPVFGPLLGAALGVFFFQLLVK